MTEQELAEIESHAEKRWLMTPDDIRDLVVEVRRLQGLIKQAEYAALAVNGICDCVQMCPWCESYENEQHDADCPAFGSTP